MQRNKLLAREILEIISEEDNSGGGLYREEIYATFAERHPSPEHGREEHLDYHLRILEEAGFVKRSPGEDVAADNFEMTWAGHDFLEIGQEG